MTHRWLSDALRLAGVRDAASHPQPRELREHAFLCLPVTEVRLGSLTTTTVAAWAKDRGIEGVCGGGLHRELHGCLVARRGSGALFVSSDDSDAEQLYTFAHELAHFVLDYLEPRGRALSAFGERIRPVLDGDRPPTKEELLGAALDGVPLGTKVHLMSRSGSGMICSWDVEDSEQRADRLALELLVPARVALAAIRAAVAGELHDEHARRDGAAVLRERFALPADAANAYADLLLGRARRRVSTLDLFGKG